MKERILIVEDSFIVAFHLQKTLESEGYEIVGTETSGEQALIRIEQAPPDLVLMDIMLSGELDGIQTAGAIQSRYHLPVIYITALTDKDTIQRAKVTEPFGYLTKPFEDRQIFTVIEMGLYKHRIESKLRQSEERYYSTIRSINDAVIIFDVNFQLTYLNPSAEALIATSLEASKGKSVFDVLHFKDSVTGADFVNPVQCLLGTTGNKMPENLVLVNHQQREIPIGEGSLSAWMDGGKNLIGLILVFKDITDRVSRQALEKEMERQRLSALLEGQENERSRISKDLHDGLGQMLNAIKMNINFIVRDNEKSKDILRLIDEAIQESVRISEDLVPSKLRDFDLATCLRSLCENLDRQSQPAIQFESLQELPRLDQRLKVNLYRIAQEAINNALKYAHAAHITVQLNGDGEHVHLSIEDDGVGVTLPVGGSPTGSHRGLRNMQDRAMVLGGRLIIESDANRGTFIFAEIPLQNSHG